MIVKTNFENCIICLQNPVEGLEHIIPECIGGRLKSNLLCKKCNNKLGYQFVGEIKNDPTFRLAVEALKGKLPGLSSQFLEKATYTGFSVDGTSVRLTKRGKQLQILRHENKEKGVLELDNVNAENYLIKRLQRASRPEDEIKKIIRSFRDLDNLEPLIIPTGEKLQKIPIDKIQSELKTEFVEAGFWVIMAYEFLSLVIGKEIYHSYFDQVRDFILSGKLTPSIAVGSYQGSKIYEPNHILGIAPEGDRIIVYIKLFGWIYQRVTFFKVSGNIIDLVYHEDLKNRKSLIALSRADAKKGVWLEAK